MKSSKTKENKAGIPEVFDEYWEKMESHLRSRYSEGDILRYNEYSMYLVNTLVEELSFQNSVYSAVELGCGRGDSSLFFEKRGWQTFLVDLSEVALRIAKHNFADHGLSFSGVKADITNTPFKESRFDIVMNYGVLEHFKDPIEPLAEMFRILKPGGMLFATVLYTKRISLQTFIDCLYHIPGTFIINFFIKRRPGVAWKYIRGYMGFNNEPYENELNIKDYLLIMEKIGFSQFRIVPFTTIPYLRLPSCLEKLYIGLVRAYFNVKQRVTKKHPLCAVWGGRRQWLLYGRKPSS